MATKKLDILVPQYNEDEKDIKFLLDSIAIQQAVDLDDVGVIIVNDGNPEHYLSDEFLKKYPFDIKYIKAEHQGVSATRQRALDESRADYVMFCDADDGFCSAMGLYVIFNEFERGFDGLISVFLEEYRDKNSGKTVYINHQLDSTFVHGKVYRRGYLLEKDIKWNPNLQIHEDSWFQIQAQKFTDPERIKFCPQPFYVWRWRDESVCRRSPTYLQETYVDMVKNLTNLVPLFLDRGYRKEAKELFVFSVIDAYYSLNKKEWIDKANKQFRDMTEEKFYEYFKKFKYLYDETDEQQRLMIQAGVRQRMFQEGLGFEQMTFEQWMTHLKDTFDANS